MRWTKVSFLLSLGMAPLMAAAKSCNAAVAMPQSKYAGTFTWQGTTRTVGTASKTKSGNFQASQPTSTDAVTTDDWLQWGVDGVNNVANKRRADALDCLANQVCLSNDINKIPFCLDERTGGWHGATGYEGNVVNGDFWAPDGSKGNIYNGPCPGNLYVTASKGCALAQVTSVTTPSLQQSSQAVTPTMSTSRTPTPTPNSADQLKMVAGSQVGILAGLIAVGRALA